MAMDVVDVFTSLRSRTEMEKLSVGQLTELADHLHKQVTNSSQTLVKLLRSRDHHKQVMDSKCERLTELLRRVADENDQDADLKFTFKPVGDDELDFIAWSNSWSIVAATDKGVPKHWRKQLWETVAEYYTSHLDWTIVLPVLFREETTEAEQPLLDQINRGLQKLSRSWVSHEAVTRIILAYARHTRATEIPQELCVITPSILKTMEGMEHATFKILLCLLEHRLPSGYLNDKLQALTVDVAVLREMLEHLMPRLFSHMEHLRLMSHAAAQKSYSHQDPPVLPTKRDYEPPLVDAFSVQWLMTLFSTCLPKMALRRLWDAILIEGADFLLYAALAVWATFEIELLDAITVPDFYAKMAELTVKLKNSQFIPSHNLINAMYTLRQCSHERQGSLPSVAELRWKHSLSHPMRHILSYQPPPSQAGNLFSTSRTSINSGSSSGSQISSKRVQNNSSPMQMLPAVIPSGLTATAICPQTKKAGFVFAYAYAADVPEDMVHHYPTSLPNGQGDLFKQGKGFTIPLKESS